MSWSSRVGKLVAKPAFLSRHAIAAAGLLGTVLLSQDDERGKDDKSEEGKWSSEACMARLFPNYSFATATVCDFDSQTPGPFQRFRRTNTRRKMKEEVTDKKLAHLYKVAWDRPLGEGGFARVYLGKDKKLGGLGKTTTENTFLFDGISFWWQISQKNFYFQPLSNKFQRSTPMKILFNGRWVPFCTFESRVGIRTSVA